MFRLCTTSQKNAADQALAVANKHFPEARLEFVALFKIWDLLIPRCSNEVRNAIMSEINSTNNKGK